MKKFDLNIEKILENWEVYHAIREIISNAIDEQIITNTNDISITKADNNVWYIIDYGRGISYTNLTQNENQEKLSNPNVIGKFGIGLKDAMATFDRKGIEVYIKSRNGNISLIKSQKENFSDIVTLHAVIEETTDPIMIGTTVILKGVSDSDMDHAMKLFLRFSGEKIIEKTRDGEVIRKNGKSGNIYINGVKVAEEERFLFSYNITKLNTSIKKALNRERTNVGRTAYSDRIKSILLGCQSKEVASILAEDLQNINIGTAHDELTWIDVQEHACKILNKEDKVLFVSSYEIMTNANMIDEARSGGYNIITIPENLSDRIKGSSDIEGNPIVDMSQFVNNFNDSFEFTFVEYENLENWEKEIFSLTEKIISLSGGKPSHLRDIKISETMRLEVNNSITLGLYDYTTSNIIILRKQLSSVKDYAGTLVHELTHARTGYSDVSREFESELTNMIGLFCEKALKSA